MNVVFLFEFFCFGTQNFPNWNFDLWGPALFLEDRDFGFIDVGVKSAQFSFRRARFCCMVCAVERSRTKSTVSHRCFISFSVSALLGLKNVEG